MHSPIMLFESLEPRQFLDGNVDVALNGRTLNVIGDSADNAIIIFQHGSSRLEIVPLDGTSINGKPPGQSEFIDFTRLDAINANLNEGNDRVSISPYVDDEDDRIIEVQNIWLRGGAGDDTLGVAGVSARKITLDGGPGDNHAAVSSWGSQDASFRTVVAKSIRYVGGDGNDQFGIYGVHVGDNVIANVGDGNNMVTVQTLEVDGPDFNVVIGHHLKVFGGSGNDSVFFDDYENLGGISIGGYAILDLDGGNNYVGNMTFKSLAIGRHFNIIGSNLEVLMSGVSVGKNMKIVSLDGDSYFDLEKIMTGGHLQIYSFGGSSNARVVNSEFGGSLYASLTGPVVDVYLQNLTAERMWLLGGPGTNTLHDLGGLDFDRPPIVRNFSVV